MVYYGLAIVNNLDPGNNWECALQEPLQSMLSGLGFQQGLLQAAASVAAQAGGSFFSA